MKKEEKATSVTELHEKFTRAKLAVMTECSGVPVNQVTELRKLLRNAKAEFKVVKNTLAARAVDGTDLMSAKPHLKGPMALMIGYDDPVLPTKILRDFIKGEKRDEKMRITAAVLEGKLLQTAQLLAVASLPTKLVLISMLLSAMQGPAQGLVIVLN